MGKIGFVTTVKDGVLAADLQELALYGGQVTGQANLDASGEALDVKADFALDKVDLGALSAVGNDGQAPLAGIGSGTLSAQAQGASPKALVQALKGGVTFQLGAVDLKNATAGALSGADLAVDLPGLSQSPTVKGSLVYNKQKVELDVALDPLDKVLAGETFALKAAVSSQLLNVSYDGAVQQQPLPGLDGGFSLESPSVGQLASWLGQPLPADQPDPGPLKVAAVLKAAGEQAILESATIEGEALQASASGSVDISGEIKKIKLDVKAGTLDIDRYLPPPAAEQAAASESADGGETAATGADPLAAIPDEPLDLSALKGTEADVSLALEGLRAAGFALGQTDLTVKLAGGNLAVGINKLALYGGEVAGQIGLDGSAGDSLAADVNLAVTTLNLGDLARAAGQEPAPLEGVLSSTIKATTQGANPRALVLGLSADIALQMQNMGLAAAPEIAIGALDGSINLPAMDQTLSGKFDLTLNGEPVSETFSVNSPLKALQGEAFDLQQSLQSAPIKASINGKVQQKPLPGLDGKLSVDIASVGGLASWLGFALPEGQPDPGPLKIDADLAADGGKVAVQQASIVGKAAQATASGSFDGTGEVAQFDGRVDVANLDLNAYLPDDFGGAQQEEAAASGPAGWSEEPIDASALRGAEGQLTVTLASVLYKEVTLQQATAAVTLKGGVLTADLSQLQLSPGQVAAKAVVDASGEAVAISYGANLQGVEAKPFLTSFAGLDWLSGKMNATAQGRAIGQNQKQIVSSLNGDGNFSFLDGAIEGFDLAGTLRNLGSLGASAGEKPKTDFTELSGSFTIVNGLLNNPDLRMASPLVRVKGAGDVPLPPQTVDYRAEAKLVASLEGQGGQDSLAGIPVPVHIFGPWSNVDYNIDFASLVTGAAVNPEALQGVISGEGAGGVVEGLLGGGSGGDEGSGGVGGLLQGVLGGGSQESQPAQEESSGGPAPSTDSGSGGSSGGGSSLEDTGKTLLKGLFGN